MKYQTGIAPQTCPIKKERKNILKKKLLSLALALVMSLGLAVPAFAADSSKAGAPTISVTFPDGYEADSSTDPYQIREVNAMALRNTSTNEIIRTLITRAGEPSGFTIPSVKLPLGATISVSGLRNDWSAGQADVVTVTAYSDPDGDGVYDQWIYSFKDDPPVVPLAEESVAYGPEENGNYSYEAYLTKDNVLSMDVNTLPASVSVTTDYLNEVFGPNTLLVVSLHVWTAIVVDPLTALSTGTTETAAYLLTGEEAPAAPVTSGAPDVPIPTQAPDFVPPVTAPEFTDVPAGKWYAAPVAWAVENNITNGATTTTFAPTDSCTQEQILTFLYRAQRNTSDTPAPASAEDMAAAVSWAREQGMIDDSFNGKELCTRATAVSYIWQALGSPDAAASSFSDVSAGASYASAVNWAVEIGVTEGTGNGAFSPSNTCDRATIVTFLQRAYVPSARLK